MARWAQSGTLTHAWQRRDMSGAFLVLNAPDLQAVTSLLSELPLHPFMNTEIVAIQLPAAGG
jgi:muconolactone delta-isomerase